MAFDPITGAGVPEDSVTGQPAIPLYTDRAAHIVLKPVGTSFSTFILQTDANGEIAGTPAYPQYRDGCNAKEVYIFPITALPAGPAGHIISWSTDDSDAAALKVQMEAFRDRIATPGSVLPPLYSNCIILNDESQHDPAVPIAVASDENNLIQTIGITNTAAAAIIVAVGIVT